MNAPPPLTRHWPALLVVAVAAVGANNPVDELVRGKWVRFMDTQEGHDTTFMCMEAETLAEVDDYRDELPERVRALHANGATVVVIDVDLSAPHASDEALVEAARVGPTIFAEGANPAFAEFGTGTAAMDETWFVPMVLGSVAPTEHSQPLALEALALHEGVAPPSLQDGHVRVGDHVLRDASQLFQPYLSPFVHWTRQDTWPTASGRVVFVGACRADRSLTHFGRQPRVVAHAEILETVLNERMPWRAPFPLDVLVALLSYALAHVGRRRLGIAGALAAGVVALGAVSAIALGGFWFGLSGVVAATLVALRPPPAD